MRHELMGVKSLSEIRAAFTPPRTPTADQGGDGVCHFSFLVREKSALKQYLQHRLHATGVGGVKVSCQYLGSVVSPALGWRGGITLGQ